MKIKILLTLLAALIFESAHSLAQGSPEQYTSSTLTYPSGKNLATSFYINETGKIFLPLNGGIYLPQDSLWFIPPAKLYSFTSFAPVLKDTSMFVVANTDTASQLYYIKSSVKSAIRRYAIAKFDKGLYNVIYKNDVCYVWGYSSGSSKIGILAEDTVRWLINLKGIVKQVQVNDSAEIFFAYNNAIYELSKRQAVLQLDTALYGFDFDEHDNLIISYADGIALKKADSLFILATGIAGLVEYENGSIFILDRRRNAVFKLSQIKTASLIR